MRTIIRGLVAIAVTAAALSLSLTAPVQGSADGTSATPAESVVTGARPMTKIVLRVRTCRRCPVQLRQALDDGTYWSSRTHRVRRGHVRFRVPTSRTRGMSFEITPHWATAGNWVPNVVTRYSGTDFGESVSNAQARHKKRATACWTGTDARRVRLVVRAVKFRARTMDGDPGHGLRAWFSPMGRRMSPMNRTWRGSLGNQDAYFCEA